MAHFEKMVKVFHDIVLVPLVLDVIHLKTVSRVKHC